jgi:hypothetical protein
VNHDELLARIAKLSITPETNVVPSELATALMAVVELHKPFEIPDEAKNSDTLLQDGIACYLCSTECYHHYPCPTIQAIEKELG